MVRKTYEGKQTYVRVGTWRMTSRALKLVSLTFPTLMPPQKTLRAPSKEEGAKHNANEDPKEEEWNSRTGKISTQKSGCLSPIFWHLGRNSVKDYYLAVRNKRMVLLIMPPRHST